MFDQGCFIYFYTQKTLFVMIILDKRVCGQGTHSSDFVSKSTFFFVCVMPKNIGEPANRRIKTIPEIKEKFL